MGDEAYGLLAQSVGGGGGVAGSADSFGLGFTVAIGGAGGQGGNGGEVNIVRSTARHQSITTQGNSASAIFAQSVGGSGGAGGYAAGTSWGLIQSWTLAIGGAGGAGGHGGTVSVGNGSQLSTHGTGSHGILAQSIGGGGGLGGSATADTTVVSGPQTPALALAIALGGSGGGGGRGGAITVDNRADISTAASNASAIKALSVGGGGGSAGSADTHTNLIGFKQNLSLAIALGGSGGRGGDGGGIRVRNDHRLSTEGQFSPAIAAASIGGGGGVGGSSSTNTVTGYQQNRQVDSVVERFSIAKAITVDTRVGGSGGDGGRGGDVSIHTTGPVGTAGSNSTAVFAQSVGGGGGSAGGFSGGGGGTLSGTVSVGGSGGRGGAGGNIDVGSAAGADIGTRGDGSHGMFAQSVGGGGGTGGGFTGKQGTADLSWESLLKIAQEFGKYYGMKPETKKAIEQSPKPAGKFEGITNYLKGFDTEIITNNDLSVLDRIYRSAFYLGLQATNLAYHRELNAFNRELKAGQVKVPNAGLTVSVGGAGGTGGIGGNVFVDNRAAITTEGSKSYAVLAQSVGGGGGAGGAAYANGHNQINATLAVGGSGTVAGRGGDVRVHNHGRIETRGESSYGMFAQSVGGGGGIGGASANADTISLSANVGLGGSSGVSSPGGAVSVEQLGEVHTHGRQAHAVVAQSVGGGGGTFYLNAADPLRPERFADDVSEEDAEAEREAWEAAAVVFRKLGIATGGGATFDHHTTVLPKPSLSLRIGGHGGAGGDGGTTRVVHTGTVSTSGDAAFGVFAQSIGGGGGFGGDTGTEAGVGYLQGSMGIGGSGGTAGHGGVVIVELGNHASVATSGTGAAAVVAQSVGGGGGYAGSWHFADGVPKVARIPDDNTGSSGNGGSIRVGMTSAGDRMAIHTSGKNAHGIVAQSLGGGGGMVADADGLLLRSEGIEGRARQHAVGSGGLITVDTAGEIRATGEHAYGIYAQSGVQKTDASLDPNRSGGDIRITHNGVIVGGSGQGAAIVLDGGADNIITLGAGSSISAVSGTAIRSSFGNDRVNNFGTVTGGVDLVGSGPGGVNAFYNHAGARLNTSGNRLVRLGARGTLTNAGTMDIGGAGVASRATVEGDFLQTPQGTLLVDISPSANAGAPASDHLAVTGKAQLDGAVTPDVVSALLPGRYTFITADGGLSGAADARSSWPRHVPVSWSLQRSGNSMALVPQARFASPEGVTLSQNQAAVARHLQEAWDAGSAHQADAFARFANTATAADYATALDSLNPENVQASAVAELQASRAALKAVMSCPAFVGTGTTMREGECTWGRVTAGRTRHSDNGGAQGYRLDHTSYRVGLQREVRPDWFLGLSAGYGDSRLYGAGGLSRSDGDRADVALALKHQRGNWLLAGSVALGYGWYDNRRHVHAGNERRLATSSTNVFTAATRLRAGYQWAHEDWYVRPQVDLDLVYSHKPGYGESGAGSLDLEVSSMRDFTVALRPNVELGGKVELASGGWLRPYGMVGFSLLSEDELSAQANFRGVASRVNEFRTSSHMTQVLGDAGLGVQWTTRQGYEVTAGYRTQFGRHFTSHEGSARLAIRF